MAIDSTKATLAVKRRLACEMVKYWQQVTQSFVELFPTKDGFWILGYCNKFVMLSSLFYIFYYYVVLYKFFDTV